AFARALTACAWNAAGSFQRPAWTPFRGPRSVFRTRKRRIGLVPRRPLRRLFMQEVGLLEQRADENGCIHSSRDSARHFFVIFSRRVPRLRALARQMDARSCLTG